MSDMRLVSSLAALALWMSCASAIAGEPASKPPGKPDTRPELLTMDQKVADSKIILIGEGVRIYFIDRQYREIPFIRAAGEGSNKNAMVVVKVIKVLHPPGAEHPGQALIPIGTTKDIYGERRSPYDERVALHVGKQGIWFGEFVVHNEYGDGASRRPLENPVTLFNSRVLEAKRGLAANPLPVKQLKEVMDSIGRVK